VHVRIYSILRKKIEYKKLYILNLIKSTKKSLNLKYLNISNNSNNIWHDLNKNIYPFLYVEKIIKNSSLSTIRLYFSTKIHYSIYAIVTEIFSTT